MVGYAVGTVDGAMVGKAVGEVMVVKTEAEKHRGKGETKVDARMRELFKKYEGLEEISAKYEFFQNMMVRVVQNKLRLARLSTSLSVLERSIRSWLQFLPLVLPRLCRAKVRSRSLLRLMRHLQHCLQDSLTLCCCRKMRLHLLRC